MLKNTKMKPKPVCAIIPVACPESDTETSSNLKRSASLVTWLCSLVGIQASNVKMSNHDYALQISEKYDRVITPRHLAHEPCLSSGNSALSYVRA